MNKNLSMTHPPNMVFVLMRSYNASEFITEAIESFLQQTRKNKKLVIVDDCSSDNTISIVNEYAKNHKEIYFTNECQNKENVGAGHSFVKLCKIALKLANPGDLFFMLDDDDKYLQNGALEMVANRMQSTKADVCFIGLKNLGNIKLVAKGTKYENQANIISILSELKTAKTINMLPIIAKAHWMTFSRVYTKEVLARYVELMPQLTKAHRISEDLMSISSLLLKDVKYTSLAEPIYGYRRRENSLSKQQYTRKFFLGCLLFLQTGKNMVVDNIDQHVRGAENYLNYTLNLFKEDNVNRIRKLLKEETLDGYSVEDFILDFDRIISPTERSYQQVVHINRKRSYIPLGNRILSTQ